MLSELSLDYCWCNPRQRSLGSARTAPSAETEWIMRETERAPAVFTPDNEPYLGLQSVLWFDRIIVWALESNHQVAAYTHSHRSDLSPLQRAGCQITPQGVNIALSIRELVRQGYLFPAMVLMRPLIERAAVISYLALNPRAVSLWE